MKTLLYCAMAFMALIASAVADEISDGTEFVLEPVDTVNISKLGWEHCGRYFLQKKDTDAAENTRILFFGMSKIPSIASGVISQNRIISVIDSGMKKPVVMFLKNLGRGDSEPLHLLIRINEQDAKAAKSCLPEPASDPRAI